MIDLSRDFRSVQSGEKFQVITLKRNFCQEFHCTVQMLQQGEVFSVIHQIALVLQRSKASVVRYEIFGALSAREGIVTALVSAFGTIDWPITWVEGQSHFGEGIAGMNILAVAGTPVDTVNLGGKPVGRVFNDGYARHCLLGDLTPANASVTAEVQCQNSFAILENTLGIVAMSMSNFIRTWFYLDDITDCYPVFNVVRNRFFRERNMISGLMPASTGIGGRNPSGTRIIAGAWAVQNVADDLAISEAVSPLQRPSFEYGSAFSRAITIETQDLKRLFISGTASIEPNGLTAHRGETNKQIALTMEIVKRILSVEGFCWPDVTRAIAYFKNFEDRSIFADWLVKEGVGHFPTVYTQADICREELLFEIELDAITLKER